MYITFLVGNGFDIGLGLDTSYKSFCKWYSNQPSTSAAVEELKQEIKKDIDNGGENWADLEIGLGRYTSYILPGLEFEFLDCYEDVHEKMLEYIENEKNKFDLSSLASEISLLRSGLLKFYEELPSEERQAIRSLLESDRSKDTILQFISFNYTDTLDQCTRLLAQKPLRTWKEGVVPLYFRVNPSVVHIHGILDEYPILGVNDPSQIANPELLSVPQFSEVMIKPESVNAIGRLWHENASNQIENSSIVCIYGMSLGASDEMWWRKLLSWLMESPERHLVIYWYANSPQINRSIIKRNREILKVKDRMLSFYNPPMEIVEFIENRIHVILNTNNVLKASLKRVVSTEKELVKV